VPIVLSELVPELSSNWNPLKNYRQVKIRLICKLLKISEEKEIKTPDFQQKKKTPFLYD
jgi:hypothetical protein